MKPYGGYLVAMISLIVVLQETDTLPFTGPGNPLKYISSCELDFNNDGRPDIALLVETPRSRELIVLVKTDRGYGAYVLSEKSSSAQLSCHFGKTVQETLSGKGVKEMRSHKTPGTYIRLAQPEGASVVYFWTGNGFKEVWTAD